MKYIPATELCTKEQIQNLRKLLDGMKKLELKTGFNMRCFGTHTDGTLFVHPLAVKNECGTVCCLAGHGPLVGIPTEPSDLNRWSLYTQRVFTSDNTAFYFVFGSCWDVYQPTKEEALFRLELFLTKGVPETFATNRKLYHSSKYSYGAFSEECRKGLHTLGETA